MSFTNDFYTVIDDKINTNYNLCKERLDFFIERNEIVSYDYHGTLSKFFSKIFNKRLTRKNLDLFEAMKKKLKSISTPVIDHCSIYKTENEYYYISHVYYNNYTSDELEEIKQVAKDLGINIDIYDSASWYRGNLSLVVIYSLDTKTPFVKQKDV